MEGALVSIIVPIYNVEVYIDRCVDSILTQSYRNLEVILVDDGSNDGSGERCNHWAACDSRVKVVHQDNAGLSAARNAALDMMTGDFVVMVDGDDYIAPHCIDAFLNLISTTGADLAAAAWTLFDDGTEPAAPDDKAQVSVFDSHEAIDEVFYQHTLTNSACAKMYRARLFDDLRYPVGMLYEDLAIIYPLLQTVNSVAHTSQPLYYYRQRRGGSITSTFSRRRTHVLDIMEQLEERVDLEARQHLPAVRSRLLSAYFNILLLCPSDGTVDDIVARCWRGIKRLRLDCLGDPRVRRKNKLGILLSYLGSGALRLAQR